MKIKLKLSVGKLCWAGALLAAWLMVSSGRLNAQTHEWRDHLTRDEVLQALGEPDTDLSGGGHEIMTFKNGLTVELQNGEVSNITGTVPDALKPGTAVTPVAAAPAPTPAAPPTPAPPPTAAPPPVPAPTAAKPVAAAVPTEAVPAMAAGASVAAPAAATESTGDQDSEKIIKDFSTTSIIPPGGEEAVAKAFGGHVSAPAGGTGDGTSPGGLSGLSSLTGGASAPAAESPWTQPNTLQGFLAGLVMRTIVMTLVLKGAFAYKEFPVIWREAAVVGAGVAFCNQLMAFIFTLNDFLKMLGWIQADQLLTAVVLLTLIMNFTSAKQFPTAAQIMMATMAANIALGYVMLAFF